jgi:hypothetical protein
VKKVYKKHVKIITMKKIKNNNNNNRYNDKKKVSIFSNSPALYLISMELSSDHDIFKSS